jgi:hypothetical protein
MATHSRRLALLYAFTAVVEQGCGRCPMVNMYLCSFFIRPLLVSLDSNSRHHTEWWNRRSTCTRSRCGCTQLYVALAWRSSISRRSFAFELLQTCAWHDGLIQVLVCAHSSDALLMRQDGEAVIQPIVQFLPEVAGVTLIFRSLGMTLLFTMYTVDCASCNGRYARALRRTFRH